MTFRFPQIAAVLLLAITPACRQSEPATQPSGNVQVIVSILPQAYFLERIGGNYVDVEVLVGPGQSPHTYEPTPKQVARMAAAHVFFQIGTPFEDVVARRMAAMNPKLLVIDTRQNVPLLAIGEGHVCTHEDHAADESHDGHEGHEGHGQEHPGAPDPHVWLAPPLVKIQAGTICEALCRVDPSHAAEYRENLRLFVADLDTVDAELRQALAPLKGREFFVYHAAYGYFAHTYGLKQVSVEIGGKEASAKQLAELVARAKQSNVKLIFVQPQFAANSARTLAAEIGGAVVPMDDLARDYLNNLRDMAVKIRQALGASTRPVSP